MSESKSDKNYWAGEEGFKEVLDQEHARIAERTKRTSAGVWAGVSLSGGGIRSASFCLGALQALARYGVLSRLDYISTVSGGGYIGGGLQWLLCRDPESDLSRSRFPYGVDADLAIHPKNGQSNLQYLRWHANYLLPGKGFDIFSALTVVVRTALLSVAIWFPLIVLFFYALQLVASLPSVQSFSATYIPVGLLHWVPLCPSWKTTSPACPLDLTQEGQNLWPDQKGYFSIIYGLSFYTAYLGMSLLVFLSLSFAVVSITKFPQELSRKFIIAAISSGVVGAAILGVEFLLLSELHSRLRTPIPDLATRMTTEDFVAAVTLLTLGSIFLLPALNLLGMILLGDRYKNADYSLRRLFEVIGGRLLRYTVYALVFASIPLTYKYLFTSTSIPASSVSIVSGLVTALLGHIGQSRRDSFGWASQIAMAAVACVFLYSVLLIAYHVSVSLYNPSLGLEHYSYSLVAPAIVVISIIFGVSSNSNTTGLHRFYRDRLMELFMPSAKSTTEGRSTFSFEADRLTVSDSWTRRSQKPVGLFPIVNCNAILVNDPNPVLSSRGGSSFAITPLHIGGHEHGWESNHSYERKNREVSLATAIAASGAAANANSGYAGTGITRNRAVSLVLTLFNIRLGVWIRRPTDSSTINLLKPTPFFPNLWYGPLSRGYTARSTFVELSDGGHFENLGIYELVRRKLDLIIALDGEADPATGLPALVSLSRRIEEDFGATLTFDTSVDAIMPFAPSKARYPNDAKFSTLPFARATIRYADEPTRTTTLIYVKASLIEEAPFIARGYQAQHTDYPNESTANQFYSPAQFDAYRELGVACCRRSIRLNWKVVASILKKR